MSVRGYASWTPKAEAVQWINATRRVLDEYEEYWPLTVRQIFYRLTETHGYEKTESAYNRLTQMISRARRAGYLPWDAIRDGGKGEYKESHYYASADDFNDTVVRAARSMRLNRQRDQDAVIELWCEAGGMVPIMRDIARPFSCDVSAGGGYDSVTAKHRLAERVRDRAAEGLKTLILHVGDFDASGENMAEVLRDDTMYMVASQVLGAVRAYAQEAEEERDNALWVDAPWEWLEAEALDDGGEWSPKAVRWAIEFFNVERVALTGEQVIERNVQTAPPKPSDSRTAEFVRNNRWVAEALGTPHITAQLEALTPPELNELISGAIRDRLDMDAYHAVRAEEADIRRELLNKLGVETEEGDE